MLGTKQRGIKLYFLSIIIHQAPPFTSGAFIRMGWFSVRNSIWRVVSCSSMTDWIATYLAEAATAEETDDAAIVSSAAILV